MSEPSTPPGVHGHAIFESIFGAYPDALLLVDGGGHIVLANPAAYELLGYGEGELVGLGVEALVPEGIRPRHAQYRQAYGRNPRPRPMGTQMDLVAMRRDGTEVMVEIALSPLHDSQLPYVVVSIRGIGAYPRVKQALQRARYAECVAQVGRLAVDAISPNELLLQVPAMAAAALEIGTVGLLLLEPGRHELRVAAGVGLLVAEPLGLRVPVQNTAPAGFVLGAARTLNMPDYRNEMRVAVPPAWLQAGLASGVAVPLSDRGSPLGVLIAHAPQPQRFGEDEVRFLESLSNLLAATLQRVQTEESLNHSQRLESVGQLSGGIAHDFNNLLTVIQGNLQVLEESPAVAGEAYAQQLLGAATRASRRAAELTSKLLAFSRRQVLSPSRVDVPALLESLADMLRRTVDQRIRIEVQAAPGCPPCKADAGQLESALLNIAINARDAMPQGGVLRFACGPLQHLPADLPGPFGVEAAARGYVAIAITDTGAGMPEEVRERAFEPFFTTKEAGRGTGLGLSTVYGFARQSHGAVQLESRPGAGTTVTLCIPVHAGEADDDHGAARIDTTLPPGLRVMLVEDEPEVRAVAQRFLLALGCEVQAYSSAEHALQAVAAGVPLDLLVSDVALGTGLRGTDLARELSALLPGVAVLLVSGYSAELLDLSDTAPVAWELLAKPYSRAELQAAMAQALAAARR